MNKQLEEMRACTGMMNQMHDGGMIGGTGGGMMALQGTPSDAAAPMEVMHMMQKRTDMMEMMMQSMMEQQGMMAGAKSLDATPRK